MEADMTTQEMRSLLERMEKCLEVGNSAPLELILLGIIERLEEQEKVPQNGK